jgi:hypothetical protein
MLMPMSELPIVGRIVRRRMLDSFLVPLACVERAARTRRGRTLGTLAAAGMLLVALAVFAEVNLRPQPEDSDMATVTDTTATGTATAIPSPRPAVTHRTSSATSLRR